MSFRITNIFKCLLYKSNIIQNINTVRCRNRTKYFCIGKNKTGTTSLEKAFKDLGFVVGKQREAEQLFDTYYFEDNFEPIIEYCKTAQVFQDVPFSLPDTYKHLDKAYPGSKFILSLRDTPEQWYKSITRFHAKRFGTNGNIPTADELKNADYIRKGAPYNLVKVYNTPDDDPYNKEILVSHYENYNREVLDYFKDRPEDLLVVNVSNADDYERFVNFINADSPYSEFPWENKT